MRTNGHHKESFHYVEALHLFMYITLNIISHHEYIVFQYLDAIASVGLHMSVGGW